MRSAYLRDITTALSFCLLFFILWGVVRQLTHLTGYAETTYATVTNQTKVQDEAVTQKLKTYYMVQSERVWGNLAEYQATATIKAARKHNLDIGLLAGVVAVESEGYPFAVSVTGAKGPGQVDFKAHKGRFPEVKEERDKYDPEINIDCAAELLKEYTNKYGLSGGLQVYNVGIGAYGEGQRNPRYVAKVLKKIKEYRRY